MSTRDRLHVVVAGAGPSGLMAAETLAVLGVRVTVLEPHRSPGRKFLLAGRSGLNLTHSEPLERLLERFVGGTCAPLVRHAIKDFPPAALQQWSHDLGEKTMVGSSGRVFPTSWRATPLLRAWLVRLGELGVNIRRGARVVGIDQVPQTSPQLASQVALRIETELEPETVLADGVVLAFGGTSWPNTGSDGGWQNMLTERGVEIAPFKAANAGVTVEWSEVFKRRFEGQPIKYVRVSGLADRTADVTGDIVISALGLLGGPIYTISTQINGPTVLSVNLRPDDSLEKLTARLAKSRAGDSLTTQLRKIGLSEVACGLVMECGGRDLVRTPEVLANFITAVPVPVSGTEGVRRAISVSGGIQARSLDERFMLRNLPGVFVAGEMLDWGAPTGGYLLQACFSTGVAAAKGVVGWLGDPSVSRSVIMRP